MKKSLVAILLAISTLGAYAVQPSATPEQMALASPNQLVGMSEILKNWDAAKSDYETGSRSFVSRVIQRKDNYDPLTLSFAAFCLAKDGMIEEGFFLRELALLRGKFDAEILRDKSAKAAFSVLSMASPLDYKRVVAEQNETLPTASQKALEWDKEHPAKYERRWMAHHGLGVDGPLAINVSEWPNVKAQSRSTYIEGSQKKLLLLKELERICPGAQANLSPESERCLTSDEARNVAMSLFQGKK